MSKEQNIEQLFRSAFETFEAPVDPGVWTAVQSGIASKGAVTAVAAKTTGGIVKTLIISGATLVGGLGLGYVFFGGDAADKEKNERSNTENVIASDDRMTNEQPVNNTEQKMVDVVIPVEDKTTGKKEIIKIRVPESQYMQGSVVEDQLTEVNRDAWDKWREEKEKEKQYPTNTTISEEKSNTESTDVRVVKEEVAEDMPVAVIVANKESGMAPCIVQFSNGTDENVYNWDFGDGNVSGDNTAEHIYRQPGTYTVRLTVKSKSGKMTTVKKTIEVFEASEITKMPNVFSPNNDGVNDEYLVLVKNARLFTLSIFTRNGELIFQTNNAEQGWNGEDQNGNKMPEGLYLVYVEVLGNDNTPIRRGESFRLER